MNSSQRRRLCRLADRAREGQSPRSSGLRFLSSASLSRRQRLAIAEDLGLSGLSGLSIDTEEKVSKITKSEAREE